MTLPGNKNHVGILDKYILFSDNVMIGTMKCLFEINYESEHNPPTQPTIHPVSPSPTPSLTLLSHQPCYSIPHPTNHPLPSRSNFHIQKPTHTTIQSTTTSPSP